MQLVPASNRAHAAIKHQFIYLSSRSTHRDAYWMVSSAASDVTTTGDHAFREREIKKKA